MSSGDTIAYSELCDDLAEVRTQLDERLLDLKTQRMTALVNSRLHDTPELPDFAEKAQQEKLRLDDRIAELQHIIDILEGI